MKFLAPAVWASILMLCSFFVQAQTFKTYNLVKSGPYSKTTSWLPNYPGFHIAEHDTVVINADIKLNVNVYIEGVLIIKPTASLTGKKRIVIMETGVLYPEGELDVEDLQVMGRIMMAPVKDKYLYWVQVDASTGFDPILNKENQIPATNSVKSRKSNQ